VRIIPDFDVDHTTLCDSDLKLFRFLSHIPYFVRRFFIIEFDSEFEYEFIEFYTRIGFGEYTEARLIKCKLESSGGLDRIVICNFVDDSSDLSDEVAEYLEKFEWNPKKQDNPLNVIELYDTVFGQNDDNSAIKVTTLNELKNYNFDTEEDQAKIKAELLTLEQKRLKENKAYLDEAKVGYDSLTVDFLGE
jgi:hypothetical protein